MKLRNKKTGEILGGLGSFIIQNPNRINCEAITKYNSLAELNEEWEDYKEPKGSALDLMILTLTNFIENEPDEDKVDLENCKQMLEKLKAWKRLKDKGFRFKTWGWESSSDNEYTIYFTLDSKVGDTFDLDLLFGSEDE